MDVVGQFVKAKLGASITVKVQVSSPASPKFLAVITYSPGVVAVKTPSSKYFSPFPSLA